MAGGIANIGLGLTQLWDAQNMFMEAGNRPKYEIPDAIKAMMTESQLMAAKGLPDEQLKLITDNISRVSSSALGDIASRKGGLTGIAQVAQQSSDAYNNLGVQNANAQMANKKQLMANQQIMGNYQDQEWMMNKMLPWQETTNRAWDLKETADQNTTEGANSLLSTLTSFGGIGG